MDFLPIYIIKLLWTDQRHQFIHLKNICECLYYAKSCTLPHTVGVSSKQNKLPALSYYSKGKVIWKNKQEYIM